MNSKYPKTFNFYPMFSISNGIGKLLLIFLFILTGLIGYAQAPQLLHYQGVARNSFGNAYSNKTMTLRLSIRTGTNTGGIVYSETRLVKTNDGGLYTVEIGSTGATSTTGTIGSINWQTGTKYLQVEADPAAGSNFIDLGTTQFLSVPYAFGAVSAATVTTNANLTGVVTSVGNQTSIANGAITSDMIASINQSKVGLGLVNNTSDEAKPISTAMQAALDLKASAIQVNDLSATLNNKLNIADSTVGYVTPTQLASKTFDQTPINNAISGKLNIADSLTKYITPAQLAGYNFSSGGGNSNSNNSSSNLSFLAPLSKSGNDVSISAASGSVNGYLSAADFTNFSNKIDASQKAANNGVATLGNDGKIPSTQIPAVSFQSANVVSSQAAMLGLSNAQVGSIAIRTDNNNNYVLSALPATTLSNWIQLATPNSVTSVNGNAGPNVTLTTSDVAEGTNKFYTDARVRAALSATSPLVMDATNGNISIPFASSSSNGYLKATDFATFNNKQNTLSAGVDYLAPNGSAASLTNFPTLNQNTTGTAANVSGTVGVANGGTGATTLSGYIKGNGTAALVGSSTIPVADVTGAAPLASPIFTGTPSLPTGTSGVTQSAGDNSTKIATTAFVASSISSSTPDASTSVKGKIQLAGDLAGTAALPTVPGLLLKEDVSNKSNAALGNSTTIYPTQSAVKTYVDAQVASGAPDADATTKGKIQLAGDLGGTATAPTVPGLSLKANTADVNNSLALKANSADVTSSLTLKANTSDVNSSLALKAPLASPTFTGTVGGISKSMVGLGNVDNTTDLLKPISTATQNALDLKANTSDINSSLALKAPLASPTFTGTVGGISKSMVGLGNVDNTTDLLKPISTATQNALDLKANLASPSFTGTPSLPTGTTAVTQSAGDNSTKLATTEFVTSSLTAGSPDATTTSTGKIQLAGDLGGTATAPTIAAGAITSSKILDATIATVDLADGSVTDAKIAAVAGSKVSGNITGNATNVTGTVAVANGGTGATTLSGIVKGNGVSAMTVAVAGTDYQAPITLTTTGSGAATLSGNTLNIPSSTNYTLPTASSSALGGVKVGNNLSIDGSGVLNANISGKMDIADTASMLSNYRTGLNNKLNLTDTSNMLFNYKTGLNNKLNKSDTTGMLSSYLRKIDTASLSNRINAKFNTSDTSSLNLTSRLASKLNYSDTSIMLNPYLRKTDNAASATLASTVTTNANLTGDVTSVGNASTVVKINGTSLAGLSTGILKNTTTTGVPTIAVAGSDYVAPSGTFYIGTTQITHNRSTAAQTLTGTSIDGNAATATLAGNITATSNTTLTSLASLNAVGTITSGTISLTTNIVTSGTLKAGTLTYPNTDASTSGQVLTSLGSGTLSWTTVSSGGGSLPTTGNTAGDMLYWNGTAWVKLAAGSNGQKLIFIAGAPKWIGTSTTTVQSTTGRIWMDRNLGATQVATSSTDASSFGGLYQWGRGTDGHEIRTSTTTNSTSATDIPGHGSFITQSNWRTTLNDLLWQDVNGVNNPCPYGFRLPTFTEIDAERALFSSQNAAGAFASVLKLPQAGFRWSSGSVDPLTQYWTSSLIGTPSVFVRRFYFDSGQMGFGTDGFRGSGMAIRCIMD